VNEARAALIFDGACGFCRRAAEALRRRDPGGLIELVPLQDPAVAARWPELAPEALDRAMHLVLPGGRVLAGADALPEILRRLPRWRRTAWVFSLPGSLFLARRAYALIARNRHRLGCRTSGCSY
jgi:predicted DCC family thiol-disulfide oxidoreductase YuxK